MRQAQAGTWLTGAAALALAAGLGFGVARLTSPKPASPEPAKPAETSSNTVEVPAAYLASAGIAVQPVTAGDLRAEVLAPATVTGGGEGEAAVTAHAAGSVTRLVKRLGDSVRAGETLALVESRDAAGMAADRRVADAKLAMAEKDAAREQSLYDQHVSPRRDLEAAQAALAEAQAEARRARDAGAAAHLSGDGRSVAVVSPISGRISAQAAQLGAFVQPDAELFRVANGKGVLVNAAVTAADAARIKAGDEAVVLTSSGGSLPATVRSVTTALDPATRAATVVLTLKGEPSDIAIGEAVQARIRPAAAAGPSAIVVPEEAVQRLEGRDSVFVRTEKGFRAQPVQVGARGGGRAAILSGLRPGQSIATRNAFLLKAELGKGAEDEE